MGWKNIKEAYNIAHIVQTVEGKGICIGSWAIHDIIVIGFDGVIKKRYDRGNDDLERYQTEFDADPEKLKSVVLAEDHFESSITVYTYDGGNIVEKLCEKAGWPNVTHDGQMMYDNTFSTNRAFIVERAISDAEAGEKFATERIKEKQQELREAEEWLIQVQSDLRQLRSLT